MTKPDTSFVDEILQRTYRQHNTKRGYEFFIDEIPYAYSKCAGRVWIDKKKNLSRQCSRDCGHMGTLFCKQHLKIEGRS